MNLFIYILHFGVLVLLVHPLALFVPQAIQQKLISALLDIVTIEVLHRVYKFV